PSNDINDPREQIADRVNGADLAALFGIGGPAPPGPAPWTIEKYVGINPHGSSAYPGYVPPSRQSSGASPGAESSRAGPPRTVPVAYVPPPPPAVRTPPPPAPRRSPTSGMVASAQSFGFRSPGTSAKKCST
ncbi:MAG TPA: hypothetical protein VFW33_16630, partial [Gemmataceae bacterium]|nr:hypothetical protein [Gemmataceae bacterium]